MKSVDEQIDDLSVKADGGGMRNNEGKLRIDLLPAEWIEGLATLMTAGVKIYAERNWERGMKWSTCLGCLLRHLYKFMRGHRYDDGPGGTGCHHMICVSWNALALMSYDLRGIGENDLWEHNTDLKLKEEMNND